MKKKKSPKFLIYFQVVKFISYVLKTFVNTLYYNNDEDIMIYLSCKMFFHDKLVSKHLCNRRKKIQMEPP
jgi:hypothetical protein